MQQYGGGGATHLINTNNTDIANSRGAQPFWTKGQSVLFLVHSRAEDKIMSWIFKSQV